LEKLFDILEKIKKIVINAFIYSDYNNPNGLCPSLHTGRVRTPVDKYCQFP
jgi:hypothetical protein